MIKKRKKSVTFYIILFILISIVSFGIYLSVRRVLYGQVCMTTQQIAADSRCLYIYNNNVYEKGTRALPHKGNACGTDVTAFIPSFHYLSSAQYLDPNFVGSVCAIQPSPTPTTPVSQCTMKSSGDSNCNNTVDLADFEQWRKEYLKTLSTITADFDSTGSVTLADYQIWRTGYLTPR